jgi:archaemetzincin
LIKEKIVYLIKIGEVNQLILNNLRINLEELFDQFDIQVEILQGRIKLRFYEYNLKRKQYKAAKILRKLIKKAKKYEIFKILGITEKDIYSRKYNFIFGLASRGSHAALISLARLRENFYLKTGDVHRKLGSNEEFNERILKEAIHELGHTFRLKHCTNFCVMQFSNSLADTDKKTAEFCELCLGNLKKFL